LKYFEGKTMKRTFTAAVLLAGALAMGTASAADIDGTWVGMVAQSEITFVLKADGEKLTGTLDNAAQPGATELKDGKIKGADVSFHVLRTLNEAETKVEWTGKLAGDELTLQRAAVAGNEPAPVVAKRKKE
jgi:uncharacterized protein (DUF2147 family)